MQSAFINSQQYASPMAQPLATGFQPSLAPMSNASIAPAGMGMTQLPNVPMPPYLGQMAQSPQPGGDLSSPLPGLPTPDQLLSGQPAMRTTSYIIPGVFGNGGAMGAQSGLPTPCQAAPALCNGSAQPYQTASSFPINMLDPSAEVPSPYMVAPWLYLAKPAMPQTPQAPAYPPQQPAMQQQQPKMPTPQPQPPMPPPQQPPQQPPQAPPQQKGPTTPLDQGGLTDTQIQSLNDRLNNDSEDTRADAAMELFKILDKDPTLSNRAPYDQYVNAFMEKIMKDPSAVVRTAGELALQTGRVKQPSEGLVNQLSTLNKSPGGLSGEGGVISSLMGSIKNSTLGQGFEDTPGAMTTVPGSTEAAAQQKGATPQQANPNGMPPGQENPAQPTQGSGQGQPGTGQQAAAPGYGPATAQAGMVQGQQAPLQQQPFPQAYNQPAASGGYGMAQGFPPASGQPPYGQPVPGQQSPAAGNRLNYVSQAQQPSTMMGQPGMAPQFGQRLNLQEGYR